MTRNATQIEQAIINVMGLLSHKRQLKLLESVCALIKEQRDEALKEARQKGPKMSEELAVSSCAVDDRALEEQERILQEVIAKHHGEKVRKHDLEIHQP
jgi:antitoxin component HigA of HigAB toxin-antitoxin module